MTRPLQRFLLLVTCLCPLIALGQAPSPGATLASELKVADGFKVELLRSASKDEGSWVSMAVDAKGRLYISCQGKPPGAGMKKDDTMAKDGMKKDDGMMKKH